MWGRALDETTEEDSLMLDPFEMITLLYKHHEGLMLKQNSNTLATSCEELTHWKDSDAGRDWGQEEKGTTEDEMAGWHH